MYVGIACTLIALGAKTALYCILGPCGLFTAVFASMFYMRELQ